MTQPPQDSQQPPERRASDAGMAALIASLQATLTTLQSTVTTLDHSVTQLKRIVEGEPGLNVPSLRQENKRLCDRLGEHDDRLEEIERLVKNVNAGLKWAGGGSLAALGAAVALIKGWLGGGQ